MRVFITGTSTGQLHWELLANRPTSVEIVGNERRLDLYDRDAIQTALVQLKPDVIINAAAYTAVDKAESEPERAEAINALAVAQLAKVARDINARMIHVSTDFVFGEGNGSPFAVNAATDPVNVYGKTKLAGELAIRQFLPETSTIVRTAWVYSSHGGNFVKTMLRLMNDRDEIGVVSDQVGSPTWAYSLAEAIWRSLHNQTNGILHWTGAGVASWYDFAVAIAEEALALGLISQEINVVPLTTEQFPTPAKRPSYSVLHCQDTWQILGMTPMHWRSELRAMLKEMA